MPEALGKHFGMETKDKLLTQEFSTLAAHWRDKETAEAWITSLEFSKLLA